MAVETLYIYLPLFLFRVLSTDVSVVSIVVPSQEVAKRTTVAAKISDVGVNILVASVCDCSNSIKTCTAIPGVWVKVMMLRTWLRIQLAVVGTIGYPDNGRRPLRYRA